MVVKELIKKLQEYFDQDAEVMVRTINDEIAPLAVVENEQIGLIKYVVLKDNLDFDTCCSTHGAWYL
ncbi:MAG: hypothetical protein KGL39_03495 [Patescibacteria group bacterium]|nr:hypothetical protein [Patescibacteria group bacterium]